MMKLLEQLIKEYEKRDHKPYLSAAEIALIKHYWAEERNQDIKERGQNERKIYIDGP
jgi:hypothetical protein